MKIAENIYFYKGDYKLNQIKFFNLYRGIGSSNFLVLQGEKQVLIDSGIPYGPHIKRIIKEFDKDRINIYDTETVILSHAHPDHIMGAKLFTRKKKIQLVIHKDCTNFTQSDRFHFESYFNYPNLIRKELLILPGLLTKAVFSIIGYGFGYLKADRYLQKVENENLDICTEVVNLPGHAPGHVGFYFPKSKVFYAGDLLMHMEGKNRLLLSINNAFSSLEDSLKDLDRVKELDIEVFVPGHGDITSGKDNILTMLDKAKHEMNSFIQNILLYISQKKSATVTEITKNLFNKDYICNYLHAKSIVYNTLVYLKKQNLVQDCMKHRKVYWALDDCKQTCDCLVDNTTYPMV